MEKDKLDRVSFTGSQPDSLYRVPIGRAGVELTLLARWWRVLRWPAALLAFCLALALFVYYVMPDSMEATMVDANGTAWESSADAYRHRQTVIPARHPISKHPQKINFTNTGRNEVDFEKPAVEASTPVPEKLPPVPAFPITVFPEVQYGNEKAPPSDRAAKLLQSASTNVGEPTLKSTSMGESTLKSTYKDLSCRSASDICSTVLPYDLVKPSPDLIFDLDSPDVQELVEEFHSTEQHCSQRMQTFLCHVMEPECMARSQLTLKPCQRFCVDAISGCRDPSMANSTLVSLLDCSLYPSDNCKMATEPCYDDEVSCGDGTCVSKERRCDGVGDCASKIDESDCNRCNDTHWRCTHGECVPLQWLCDGYADCPLGDDEFRCRAGPDGLLPRPLPVQQAMPAWLTGILRSKKLKDLQEVLSSPSELSPRIIKTFPSAEAYRSKSSDRLQEYSRNGESDSREILMMSDTASPARPYSYSSRFRPSRFRTSTKPPSEQLVQENDTKSTSSSSTKSTEPADAATSKYDTSTVKREDEAVFDALIEDLEKMVHQDKWWQLQQPREGLSVQTSHASPCPAGELRCVDGRCITYQQLCDGHVDCSDRADEDNCPASRR